MVKLYSVDDEEKNNKTRVNQVHNFKLFLFELFKKYLFLQIKSIYFEDMPISKA